MAADKTRGSGRLLDPSMVGRELVPIAWSWDTDDVILHALGVGATVDRDFALLYEGCGPRVLASFLSLATGRGFMAMVAELGLPIDGVLHAEQQLTLQHAPPAQAEARVDRRIAELWDKGGGALLVVEDTVVSLAGPTRLASLRSSWWVRGAGGFGGERGPRPGDWSQPPERAPDAVERVRVSPEQGALHRLSGDHNPIHIDPEASAAAGFARPILHGLSTFGMVERALTHLPDPPARLDQLTARFIAPVWPGDELEFRIWTARPQAYAVQVSAGGRTVCAARAQIVPSARS